jgi:hypothetical protein
MRYYTGGSKENYGGYLRSASVHAGATGAKENNCISLNQLGIKYLQVNKTAEAKSNDVKYTDMIDEACANCATLSVVSVSGNAADNLDACSLCEATLNSSRTLASNWFHEWATATCQA